ncbi:hypothetical protein [uncultured Ornithinimicrobium sp.]|uniref:hypothetical protein n=1 Tax=uncultured Ornithinimicrobium sp. TaxID=259307 RepID=UPI002591A250|nr:hypothetical protein [uncultured Ornithinimicrobium sp.]
MTQPHVPDGMPPPGSPPSVPAPVPPGTPPAADGPDPWQRLTPEELTRLHRPGVVPLRPLGLGDIFGGSLQTMRRNPRATVGLALLVLAALLVPSLLLSLGVAGTSLLAPTDREAVLLLVTLVFSALASTTLTGLIVHTVGEAVLGDRAGLEEAWEAVRGRIPALLGALVLMTVLLLLAGAVVVGVVVLATWAATAAGDLPAVLVAVGGGLAAAVLLVWAGSRLSLAPAPVVLERAGPWRGVRRAWALTSGRQSWRVTGITVLAGLVTAAFAAAVQVPVSVVLLLAGDGFLGTAGGPSTLAIVLDHAVQLAVNAVVVPFTAGVTALLYLDQRIRREGLDLVLHRTAQERAVRRRR